MSVQRLMGRDNESQIRPRRLKSNALISWERRIISKENLSTEISHRIAKAVQASLLEDEIVDYVFVHVDPV